MSDLPLPFMLGGPSGWGRYLHFLSAWVCVLAGLLYALYGLFSQHFRQHLLPAKADLAWGSISRIVSNHLRLKRPTEKDSLTYNVLQRLAYLSVGLAMSPAVTSVFPVLVNVFGGQQSARTVHFFAAILIVLFFFLHVALVCLAGFTTRVWAMIAGYGTARKGTHERITHAPQADQDRSGGGSRCV